MTKLEQELADALLEAIRLIDEMNTLPPKPCEDCELGNDLCSPHYTESIRDELYRVYEKAKARSK